MVNDELRERIEQARRERGPDIERLIRANLDVLNKLEPHLGCAQCHGPLDEANACPKCQPGSALDRHRTTP